jgi:hypothetical protein
VDFFRIGDGRAAEFLHDQAHVRSNDSCVLV